MPPIAFSVTLPFPFSKTLEHVTEALKAEGFGILTTIDVKATLKNKLNVDFRPYQILGACNPPLAHRALSSDARVGLLLPCNVVVEEVEEGTRVSFLNPEAALTIGDLAENEEVRQVAAEAKARLQRVAEALSQLVAEGV